MDLIHTSLQACFYLPLTFTECYCYALHVNITSPPAPHPTQTKPNSTMKPFMRRQLCLLSFLTHKIHAFAPPFNSQVARPIPSSRRPLLQPLHSTSKESQTSAVLNEQIQSLQSENALLKSRLKLLQSQNEDLIQQQQHQQHAGERVMAVEQRLILEDFEGEGRPSIGEFFLQLKSVSIESFFSQWVSRLCLALMRRPVDDV